MEGSRDRPGEAEAEDVVATTDAEDGDAVIATFRDAIESTGVQPIALLLDNKPCNLTEAVADAFVLSAAPGRGQDKAHCEGAFGLLVATADLIGDEDDADHRRLFRLAARRIASTHSLAQTLRDRTVRFLAAKVFPLT